MKAVSLWQPWASLWVSERKEHETRHWATSHRGWILVHAAKRIEFDHDPRLSEILDDEFGPHWGLELPRGALIGMVDLVTCRETELMPFGHEKTDDYCCGNFEPRRFAWRRRAFRKFDQPIPYRGAQGIFNVPDEIVSEVAA
jgi:activating signal cointegrator 1